MSSFTGGRVKEPKVRSYVRPLHVDMESYKTSGIHDGLSSSSVNRSRGSHDDIMLTSRSSSTTQFPSHHQVSHGTGIKQSHSDSMGMSLKRSHAPPTRTVHVTASGKSIRKSISDEGGGGSYHTTNTLPQSQSWTAPTINGTQHSHLLGSSIYRGTPPSTRDVPSYRRTSPSTRDVPSYRGTSPSTRDVPSYRGTSPSTRDVPSYRGTSPSTRDVPSYSSSRSTFHSTSSSSVKVPTSTLNVDSLKPTIKPMVRKTRSATHSDSVNDPTLHLPQETISSLHETIKRQKKEFSDLKGKMNRKTAQVPTLVSRHDPSRSSSTHGEAPLPIKKRKVATAPPPKTYAGFTSTVHGAPPIKTRHAPLSFTNNTSSLDTTEPTQIKEPRQPPTITPFTWRSGQETVNKVLNRKRSGSELRQQPRLPTSTLDQLTALNNSRSDALLLLQDLEEKDDEVSEDEEEEEIQLQKKKPQTKGPGPVAVKLRKILESNSTEEVQEPPKVIEKHYDREAVRKYMKSKEEEKRRKRKEEKDALEKAQNERERKLKDLQERQRQILVGNIMHQKRQQQQHSHDTSFTHLLNYSSSDDDSMMYTTSPPQPQLHTSPPTSSVYTVPSSHSPPAPPISTSMGVSRPHLPSPVSNFTTPPHRISPRVNLSFTTPPLSTSAHVALSQTPPTTTTSSVTLTHLSVPQGTTPTSSPSVTRSPSRSPKRSSDQHQARILALKQSAIALREKIQAQRKVMATQGLYSSPRATPTITTPTLPQQTEQLPGLSNIYQNASSLRERLQQNKAATKIQSAWKGYRQRKSIRPALATSHPPPPQTTPFIQVSPPIIAQSPLIKHVSHTLYTPPTRPPVPYTKTTTPTVQTHVMSPWLQQGGDPMSVVNIYTRKQEELRKLVKSRPAFEPVVVATATGNGTDVGDKSSDHHHNTSTINGKDEVDEIGGGSSPSTSSGSASPAAITPPGSSLGYDESFVTPPIYQTPPPRTSIPTSQQPRYSPHTLEMKLLTELNVLEAVEEGVRHLEGVESTKAVAEAQQETVTLAQLLKSQKQTHVTDIDNITSQARRESEMAQREFQKLTEEANKLSQRMRQIEEQSKAKDERHTQELKKVQAITCEKVNDVNQQLLSVQSSVSTAIMDVNEKQFQSAHDMAVGVAKAAAEGAVQAALKKQRQTTPSPSYQSDFEGLSFTPVKPDNSSMTLATPTHNASGGMSSRMSSGPPISTPTSNSQPSSILLKLSPQLSGGESTRSQSLTPVPSEKNEEDGDKTVTEQESDEDEGEQDPPIQDDTTILTEDTNGRGQENEDDDPIQDTTILTEDSIITNVDDEEVEQLSGGTTDEVPEDYSSHDFEDDVSDTSFRELLPSISHQRHVMKRMKTPPITEPEQPLTSSTHDLQSGDHSPSSVTGEESFFDFTSRMFNQYAKEEEMRAKHKLALLELREKAIQEKSDAELQWLKIKKGQIQKRGDDLAMPPLLKREKGILKKLKHEQAEIQRLKEVHRQATRERKMLLLQQQDIARIHHSASYYKDKIKRYGAQQQHSSREPSPYYTDMSQSPSPSPSISLSQEDIREQFSSYNTSPNKSLSHSTTSIPDLIGQSTETNQTVPVLKAMPSTNSESDSMKLRHKSAQEAERLLNKRSEELIKKRRKAEDLLRSEEELLRRKKELDEEEERINQIIEQAKKCHRQIETTKPTTVPTTPPSTRGELLQPLSATAHSINESSSAIITEIDSVSNSHITTPAMEYGFNSFESQVGVSTTPTAISTPRNSSGTLEELSQQLKVKEREIQEKKLKNQQTLELLEAAGQVTNEERDPTDIISSYTVLSTESMSGSDKPETTPIHETTPIDDILSPVSSGSSISTIVSVNVGGGGTNTDDQHSNNPLTADHDKAAMVITPSVNEVGGASLLGDSSVPEVAMTETSMGEDASSILQDQKELVPDNGPPPETNDHDITINTRVMVGNKVEGTVKYIGQTHFNQGVWIGVELDYEEGKNDGSVDGKRYFHCSPGYGIFAPPSIIKPVATSDMYTDSDSSVEEGKVGEVADASSTLEVKSQHDVPPQDNTKTIVTVERDVDIPVDDITEGLLQQLTGEALDTITTALKKKAKTEASNGPPPSPDIQTPPPLLIQPQPTVSVGSTINSEDPSSIEDNQSGTEVLTKAENKDQLVDEITNDLLKVLVSSEVSVVCSIKSAKTTPTSEEVNDNNTEVVPRPPPSTEDLIRQKSASFSSETLSLVASSKNAINAITHAAWTAVNNDGWLHRPPPEIVTAHCTMTPGPMLDCQESFVNLIYQLAIEVINDSCKKHSATNLASYYKPKVYSLQAIQEEVFKTIQDCKRPIALPPTRLLNGSCRPCGKPIDTVDMILIKELRDEEPSWVNYDKDQEEVKNRTADEILKLLIEDTVSVLGAIYQKKYSQ